MVAQRVGRFNCTCRNRNVLLFPFGMRAHERSQPADPKNFVSMRVCVRHLTRCGHFVACKQARPRAPPPSRLHRAIRQHYSHCELSTAPCCSSIFVIERLLLSTATSNGDKPSLFKLLVPGQAKKKKKKKTRSVKRFNQWTGRACAPIKAVGDSLRPT